MPSGGVKTNYLDLIPLHFSSYLTLYMNAGSLGNKLEKLEICVQSQCFDLIVIMEMW